MVKNETVHFCARRRVLNAPVSDEPCPLSGVLAPTKHLQEDTDQGCDHTVQWHLGSLQVGQQLLS